MTADELTGGARLARPGLLGPHQDWVRQRWVEGIRRTERLHADLRDRGYRGWLCTLRRLTVRLRRDTAVPALPPTPGGQEGGQLDPHPARRPGRRRPRCARADHRRCAELKATRDVVREFADMLCHGRGEHLEAWASQAEASPVSELRGFAKGLRRDWAAVTAGLTVSYSSGPVEGHVKRTR